MHSCFQAMGKNSRRLDSGGSGNSETGNEKQSGLIEFHFQARFNLPFPSNHAVICIISEDYAYDAEVLSSTVRPSAAYIGVFFNAILRKPLKESGFAGLISLRPLMQSWMS